VVARALVTGDARTQMLARIRSALRDVAEPDDDDGEAAHARRPGDPALFVERVEDYRARVTHCSPATTGRTVAEIARRHSARSLVWPQEVPSDWLTDVEGRADDPPLGSRELDHVDGVLTGAAIAVAETGTIVLDGGPISGRRAISLIPDLHICIVDCNDLVADVPDAIAAMSEAVHAGRPITLISGPSATSDIELERVEGVHGPRRLEVVLVHNQP
jgi:L-lactate dehydrogenase complex protein LldG